MAKGGLAKERFRQWQQQNRIVGQLNQLKQQGVSDDQIRQAGPNAFQALNRGPQQVTVKDGQSLDAIAQANGTTVPDLLNYNPDMSTPRTGMVLNVPSKPINAPAQSSVYANGGLPSNAAMGTVNNTNPQGANMWAGTTPGYNQRQTPFAPTTNNVSAPNRNNPFAPTVNNISAPNPFAKYEYKPPVQRTPYPLYAQTAQTPQQPAQTPAQNSAFNQAIAPQMAFRTKDDYIPTELAALINLSSTRTPTPQELAYLEKYGMITKDQPTFGGGGFGGYGRGGRGGGGGGYKPPRYGNGAPRRPAFSTGAGFGGLVNWRI